MSLAYSSSSSQYRITRVKEFALENMKVIPVTRDTSQDPRSNNLVGRCCIFKHKTHVCHTGDIPRSNILVEKCCIIRVHQLPHIRRSNISLGKICCTFKHTTHANRRDTSEVIDLTLDTSQELMSWLNEGAKRKIICMFVTFDTSQDPIF
jgi:hypothetical protein